jgi:transmembrane sensor
MLDVDQVSTEAADWFVRLLERPLADTTREEFAQWLVRAPQHVQAYLALARTWVDIDSVPALPPVDELLHHAQAMRTTASIAPAGDTPRLQGRSWWRHAAAAACTAIVLAGGWAVWTYGYAASRVKTTVGEQRSVTLPDGSVVQLNTQSELFFDFSAQERQILLKRGEAQFIVAKDSSRPFVVKTSDASVRAIGTIFNVQVADRQTAVAVIEGRVEVSGHARSTGSTVSDEPQQVSASWNDDATLRSVSMRSVQLQAGQKAAITGSGNIIPDGGPPLERVTAWPQRRLLFDDESLATVVAEFNRYGRSSLRIADSRIAGVRITGSFATYDLPSLITYLEKYHRIVARTDANGGQVLTAAGEEP